ncbi:MAG: tetratricopeptide repeat protein [Candidatus Kapabacteria bacterium]|nr:tetratricopeptide repeat protein [Candidatus Kapabacteria bacterium]
MITAQEYSTLQETYTLSFFDVSKAIELSAGIGTTTDPEVQLDKEYLQVRLLTRQGLYKDALQVAEKSLRNAQTFGNVQHICYMLLSNCILQVHIGELEIAMKYATDALRIALDSDDTPACVKIEFQFGRINILKGEFDTAREHLYRALSHISLYKDDKERGDILLNICSCYMHEGKWADAVIFGSDAIKTKVQYHKELDMEDALECGWMNYAFGRYHRVRIKDETVLADAYYNVGVAYRNLSDFNSAIEHLLHALDIKERLNETHGIAYCCNELGMLFKQKQNLPKALEYFEKGMQLLQSSKGSSTLGYIVINVADIKSQMGLRTEAIQLTQTSLSFFSGVNDIYGMITAQFNLAVLYRTSQQYSKATTLFKAILPTIKKLQARMQEVQVHYELGLLYLEKTSYGKSVEQLSIALALAVRYQYRNETASIHKSLSECYQKQHLYEQALLHFIEYEKINRELYNEFSDRNEKNLILLYEVEKHKRLAEEAKSGLESATQELKAKTQELNNFALHLVEKQEYLDTIEHGLERAIQAEPDNKHKIILELLRNVRSESLVVKEEWQLFQMQFNRMHNDFIQTMSRKYPTLSASELKVCSLLRMNLRSKEIANLLHISVKAVENHRVKLRKKLGLERDANLIHVLLHTDSIAS